MKILQQLSIFVLAGFTLCLAGGCHESFAEDIMSSEMVYVPVAPDYSDAQMWTVLRNDFDGTGADVFYIPSTWEFDWYTEDNLVSHYADPSLAAHRNDMSLEIDKVAEYMAEGNNF